MLDFDDTDPLEIVESLAQTHDWEFNRIGEDHVAIVIEGLWRHYFMSISKSSLSDGMIKLVCTFELTSKEECKAELYEVLNAINQDIWMGSFSYCEDKELMIFRYGIAFTDLVGFNYEQITNLVEQTYECCERYYPVFQMVYSGNSNIPEALALALGCMNGEA